MLKKGIQLGTKAILALADGSVFSGFSIGASGEALGEVVFNTAMTGYQEMLTDPSYAEQILTLTYPHIGNVGVNPQDQESNQIWAKALVVRELSPCVSNWRATQSLSEYLKAQQVVGIAGIDTRRLTRLLREKGAQNGCIVTDTEDIEVALNKARAYPGLEARDLAQVVTRSEIDTWSEPTISLSRGRAPTKVRGHTLRVVAYDFGVKHQILRLLVDRGCHVTVVPANTPVETVLAYEPDGVFLSNGPGDPAACDDAIRSIQYLLKKEVPLFGICLGFQLLALACGAKTYKMKLGHHGANHPVKDLRSGLVSITSQNHGFAVDHTVLPKTLEMTHQSLFDGSLQGIRHVSKPAFGFQGHPEASPGPHDIASLFDEFIALMNA